MINEYVKVTTVSAPGYFFAGVIGSVTIGTMECYITTIGLVAKHLAQLVMPEDINGARGVSYNSDSALYLPFEWSHKKWLTDNGDIKTIKSIDFEHVKAYVAKDSIASKPVYIMEDGTRSWMVTEVL